MKNPTRELQQRILGLAEPVAARCGCEVVAVEIFGSGGNRSTLRVSVDRPGGANVDDCVKVSRQLSPTLDAEDSVAGPYDLEVSTPGIERPVQRVEDWARFLGCEARVRLDDKKKLKGRIVACDGTAVTLVVAGESQLVPLESIERANLDLTLEQYARMGQGLSPVEQGAVP